MIHPQGFSSNPEFAGRIDTDRLFYAGASLGGIIGGALTSVAPDFDRSALIVPGLRFSLLLTRSTQFPTSAGSSTASTRTRSSRRWSTR